MAGASQFAQAPRVEEDEHLPPQAAWVTCAALLVAALVAAVLVGGLTADADEPAKTLVGGVGAQLASLAAIVFVVRRYGLGGRLGFGRAPLALAAVLVVGAVVLGEAVYVLFDALVGTPAEASSARFEGEAAGTIVAIGVLYVLVGPVVEEMLFRGLLFRALRSRFGFWAAALIASALFALVHVPDAGGLEGFGPRLATGLLFCGLFERTGSLWPAIAAHMSLNAIELGRVSPGAAVAFAVVCAGGALVAGHRAPPQPRPLPASALAGTG